MSSVLDAIGALVLSDLLATDDYDTPMAPWQELGSPVIARLAG